MPLSACRNNSLGIIIYEMLAGAAPFHAKAAMAFMRQHMVAEPPDLRTRVPQVSKELHELVHAMLAKEPQARPDMNQVMEQLRRLTGGPSRIGDTLVVENDPPGATQKRRTLWWFGGIALGGVLLLGSLWGVRGRLVAPPPEPVTPKVEATPGTRTPLPPRATLSPPEVQPAADMARVDARRPPPAAPPEELLDGGSPLDAAATDAAEPEPSHRADPEPSPSQVESTEPPPSSNSQAGPHTGPLKGKRTGKTQPAHSDIRRSKTKPRGKHGRSH